MAIAVTSLVTAPRALADCADDQVLDPNSGQCAAKDNENSEAPLKAAWEDAFGPLPSPEDFALARVEDPTVALPGVGLPGVGIGGVTIALPAAGAGAVTGAALPALPTIGLPAAPSLPEVGLPALPGVGLPALPGPPCVGFGTPIPFVGWSNC
jgi:hypothetical protein